MKTPDSSLLPLFYDCIEEAVAASENAPQQTAYFGEEPTKNKVRECYQEVLVDNPSVEKRERGGRIVDMHTKYYNNMTTLSILLGISAILVTLIQVTLTDAAQGLTCYYNCVTRGANNQGSLSLADVEICCDKASNGAQNADDDSRPFS